MNARTIRSWLGGAGMLALVLGFATAREGTGALAAQDGTPPPAHSCDAATPAASPALHHAATAAADHGTPPAGMQAEFDQLYIDMMIPHHASIIAMAQAALPRLTDERLRDIAQDIIDTQTAEIEELHGYRERFYGSAEPAHMDAGMMGIMGQMVPGMGTMEDMAFQMDAHAQVAAICAADDPDLAFIDLTIPHHEMAIVASEAALTQATHPEIRDFAQRVIDAQQRETDELTAIRAELTGGASPPATPGAVSHGGPVVDQVSLLDALRAEGLTVEVGAPLFPDVPFVNAQSGTVVRLGGVGLAGPADVQVYEYADEETAFADAAQILPDGSLPTVMIEWAGPPHFFHEGLVVVLYVGSDQAVLDVLTRLLGPQFAGR